MRNFSISDQRNVLGLMEKGIILFYLLPSPMTYFSFCHSHLLSDSARDSTAKFCPSVESATCAGYFLTLQMNQLIYCYSFKKKKKSQLCSLVLPCKEQLRSGTPQASRGWKCYRQPIQPPEEKAPLVAFERFLFG